MENAILLDSGEFYSYIDVENNKFTIEDVALGLSNICRYTGQVKKHYSIAQHAYIVSYVVDQEFALDGLCHDNSESFLCDIPTPLKALLPEYKAMEHKHEAEMFKRLGLQFPMHPCIKKADTEVFCAELRDLKPKHSHWDKYSHIDVSHVPHIIPWTAEKARKMYLKRFYQLMNKRK